MKEKTYKIKVTTNDNNQRVALLTMSEPLNIHSSLLDEGRSIFASIYNRERARAELAVLHCKELDETATADDILKADALKAGFFDNADPEYITDFAPAPEEMRALIIMTLYVRGWIIDGITTKEDGMYKIKPCGILPIASDAFYKTCKSAIPQIETGATTLEQAIDKIKPLYRDSCHLIDHDALDCICKKWVESEREKDTRAFVTGLFSRYKSTKGNYLDKTSPLKSKESFDKYLGDWIVTEGRLKPTKEDKRKNTTTMDSLMSRADVDNRRAQAIADTLKAGADAGKKGRVTVDDSKEEQTPAPAPKADKSTGGKRGKGGKSDK